MLSVELSWKDCSARASQIATWAKNNQKMACYPVPRAGVYAALLVKSFHPSMMLVESPLTADFIVDDVIDSGETAARYEPKLPFWALVNKRTENLMDTWVSFPWERMNGEEAGVEHNITRILQYIGEKPSRDGLKDTPKRVAKSYDELYSGYKADPKDVMTCFEEGYDEMVVLKDVEFYSTCEHHMLPFMGRAHLAYVPDGKIIGLSKLARLLEIFSRRLQVQERIGDQVTEALMEHLKPRGAAVVLEATHTCMSCRGIQKQHSIAITSSVRGCFREEGNGARQEFLQLIRS